VSGGIIRYAYKLAGVVGIDPRPHTLRFLEKLATGKQEHDYDMMLFCVKQIGKLFAGNFNPSLDNPYRFAVVQPLTLEQRKAKTADNMALWGAGLRQLAKQHKRRK
jgi:hypothetical protein